jgi:hypothetical protein
VRQPVRVLHLPLAVVELKMERIVRGSHPHIAHVGGGIDRVIAPRGIAVPAAATGDNVVDAINGLEELDIVIVAAEIERDVMTLEQILKRISDPLQVAIDAVRVEHMMAEDDLPAGIGAGEFLVEPGALLLGGSGNL